MRERRLTLAIRLPMLHRYSSIIIRAARVSFMALTTSLRGWSDEWVPGVLRRNPSEGETDASLPRRLCRPGVPAPSLATKSAGGKAFSESIKRNRSRSAEGSERLLLNG
jgi:hypothetical protein